LAKGSAQYWDWFKFEFWRFVFVQQALAKEIPTFLEYLRGGDKEKNIRDIVEVIRSWLAKLSVRSTHAAGAVRSTLVG
jgi:hypothetical protein